MTTRAARVQRRISYFFMIVASIAIFIGYVRLDSTQMALDQNNKHLCETIVFLTTPSPENTTDTDALVRIRLSNEAKADARRRLVKTFACETAR